MKASCIIVYLYASHYACVHMNPLLMDVGVSKWEDGCVCTCTCVRACSCGTNKRTQTSLMRTYM